MCYHSHWLVINNVCRLLHIGRIHHADDGRSGLQGPHCSVVCACRPQAWAAAHAPCRTLGSSVGTPPVDLGILSYAPARPAVGRKWHITTNAVFLSAEDPIFLRTLAGYHLRPSHRDEGVSRDIARLRIFCLYLKMPIAEARLLPRWRGNSPR
jgi:hypothetical protein